MDTANDTALRGNTVDRARVPKFAQTISRTALKSGRAAQKTAGTRRPSGAGRIRKKRMTPGAASSEPNINYSLADRTDRRAVNQSSFGAARSSRAIPHGRPTDVNLARAFSSVRPRPAPSPRPYGFN